MSNGSAGVGGLKFLKALVWIVYAIATAAVIILAFAFFLLLFKASPQASFVEFVYTWAANFAQPFAGMIQPTELANGGIVSWSALFAIAAYSVLAWLIASVLNAISNSIYRKSHQLSVPAATPAQQPVQPPAQPAPAAVAVAVAPEPAPTPSAEPAAAEAPAAPEPAAPVAAEPAPEPEAAPTEAPEDPAEETPQA